MCKYSPALQNITKCLELEPSNGPAKKLKEQVEAEIGKEMDKLKKA